jgi:predicted nucleotidyltransferase component of viral defense system
MEHLSFYLKSFINLVNEKGVEYLLVGGYAVRYYGHLRQTRDLDLWIPDDDPGNTAKIGEVFREIYGDIPEDMIDALSQPNRIIEIILPPVRIDIKDPIIGQRPAILASFAGSEIIYLEILNIQSGVNFHEAYSSRIMDVLDGVQVTIASFEHIKKIKQAGGRPKDLLDLNHLLK